MNEPLERIDNFVRRQIFSTAVLQAQMIECCCNKQPQPSQAQLVIAKKGEYRRELEGVAYKITIVNKGQATANNVVVEDNWPSGIEEAVDFSQNWTDRWPTQPFRAELGSLQPDDEIVLSFSIKLGALISRGSVTNTATVTSDGSAPLSVADTTTWIT